METEKDKAIPTEPNEKQQTVDKLVTEQNKVETQEQERTRIKKELFIEYFSKSFGVITEVCEKIGINRCTFYEWKKNDEKFVEELARAEQMRNEEVEDVLFKLIRTGDGASVRFYLNARDPRYEKKVANKLNTGERTLEDLLDEAKQKEDAIGQQTTDRGTAEDSQQAGDTSTAPVQPGAGVLLATENPAQPDPQGTTEGDQQGN